jgi:hypothetical protein
MRSSRTTDQSPSGHEPWMQRWQCWTAEQPLTSTHRQPTIMMQNVRRSRNIYRNCSQRYLIHWRLCVLSMLFPSFCLYIFVHVGAVIIVFLAFCVLMSVGVKCDLFIPVVFL